MHDVVFFSARLPLTKTFLQSAGMLTATPYPHITRITSHHERAANLQEFHGLLVKHAALGHCLFGGRVTAPLVDESRAGKTQKQPKDWIVFDFDRVQAKDHVEVVKRYLPPECQNVSYIVQLSASMFRPDTTLWSGHIFMLLKQPIEEQRLKQWFEMLNFTQPELTAAITLSDSQQALHWPLDRTVAYNSKLIYIAPPKCHGFVPAVKQHIQLIKKRQSHLVIPTFTPVDTVTVRQKLNELRRQAGLSEIDYATTQFEGNEVLLKSGLCDVSGLRTSGDHYIRFNLNGGDSYAYFIDLRNPALIKNFKGEPFLKTEEAAPELYKALRAKAPSITAKPPLEEGTEVLAFYATNQGSKVIVGAFNPVERKLDLNTATETSAKAWLAEWGLVQKGYLPHMSLVFNPASDLQYVAGTTTVNTFRATEYMAKARSSDKPSTLADLPPIANKVIRSILGPSDDKLVTHFVNWLAYIFQYRKKTQTAWVLNGVEGTGKGTLVKYFLRPLFGGEHVQNIQFANAKGEFNGFLERSLLVVFEEADIKSVDSAEDLMAKIKMWITDSPLPIRKMRTDVYEADNFSNFILHTNTRTPVAVSGTDRRFNFGERQDQRLFFTPNELRALHAGDELEAFADVLQRWPVDELAVTQVIDTAARQDAHEATTSINQLVAEAIQRGDLQFFLDRIPSDAEAAADFNNRFNTIGLFKAQMDKYIAAAQKGEAYILPEEDLFVLFRTLIPDTRFFQDSKTWRKRHYKSLGLDPDKQHRAPGSWDKKVRGVKVEWKKPTFLEETKQPAKEDGVVVPMRKGRKG